VRNSRILVGALVLVGAFVGVRPEPAMAGDQQCFRNKSDPLTACTICSGTCMGDGYRCCTIVPDL